MDGKHKFKCYDLLLGKGQGTEKKSMMIGSSNTSLVVVPHMLWADSIAERWSQLRKPLQIVGK